jgi:hypothetical protein
VKCLHECVHEVERENEDVYPPAVVGIKRLAGLRVRFPSANDNPVIEALQEARGILRSSQSSLAIERVSCRGNRFLTFGRNAQPTHVKTPARASLDMLRSR